jgi:hypothetical protein
MTLDEAVSFMKTGGKVKRPRFKRIAYIFHREDAFWYRLIDGREFRLPFFFYGWESVTDFEAVNL